MRKLKDSGLIFCLLILITHVAAQEKTLAERLGHPKDTKLLIIHADDIGVAHSVNAASIEAFEKKGINSGSIMVPCPWFPEIAAYAKKHPGLDLGIHVTLTAEWKNYKWGGVLSSNEIGSLLNKDGFFHESVAEFVKNAKPAEVEKEVRAQIEKAIAFGIQPTHLDSHMGSLFASPELFKIFQKLGREYKMPVLVPMNMIKLMAPHLAGLVEPEQIIVNHFFSMYRTMPVEKWNVSYNEFIEQLKPGLNEIVVHLAYDNDEMKAIAIEHPDFGSTWRQMDFNYVVSDELKTTLAKQNIKLITWKEIQKVWKQ